MTSSIATHSLARYAAVGACLVALVFQGCGASNKPVAVVNGEPITEDQLSQALLERAGPSILQQMIDELVILQAAKKAGLSATKEEVDGKLDELRARYPSSEDFDRMMASSGQSAERINRIFEMQILTEKLAEKAVNVTEEACKQHYEQSKANYVQKQQVQIRDMEFENKENAKQIRTMLDKGGDFAGLAKEFSTDPATKDNGGDMGLLPVDSLQPHLKAAVDKLKPGEISGVFEGMGAWYIIKLEKRIKERQRTYEECKEEIRDLLTRQERQIVQSSLVPKLREEANIDIKDPKLVSPGMEKAKDAKGKG